MSNGIQHGEMVIDKVVDKYNVHRQNNTAPRDFNRFHTANTAQDYFNSTIQRSSLTMSIAGLRNQYQITKCIE